MNMAKTSPLSTYNVLGNMVYLAIVNTENSVTFLPLILGHPYSSLWTTALFTDTKIFTGRHFKFQYFKTPLKRKILSFKLLVQN
jgi:hypothetical protein